MGGAVPRATSVLTGFANNRRDGWYSSERFLNLANVSGGHFGLLGSWSISAVVHASPLIVRGITVNGTQHDLIIINGMAGTIQAFDLYQIGAAALWTINVGTGFSTFNPVLYNETQGCVSTPVADQANAILYAVCAVSATPAWTLYKIDLTSGAVLQSVAITGQYPGTGTSGDTVIGGQLQFLPSKHLQRAALLMANGTIYVPFGSQDDLLPWHGWIFAYRPSDLTQTAVFCSSPSNYGAGFWGAGAGISSTSGSTLLVGGAKDYRAYVVDTLCMGHLQGSGSGCTAPQLWLTSNGAIGGHAGIYGGAFALGQAFLPNTTGPLFAYTFIPSSGLFNTTGVSTVANYAYPGPAQTSVSSSGPLNGVVWTITAVSTTETSPAHGILRALNPATLAEVYNSDANAADTLSSLNKFNPPVIADGRVYIASDVRVYVFGLGAR